MRTLWMASPRVSKSNRLAGSMLDSRTVSSEGTLAHGGYWSQKGQRGLCSSVPRLKNPRGRQSLHQGVGASGSSRSPWKHLTLRTWGHWPLLTADTKDGLHRAFQSGTLWTGLGLPLSRVVR